MLYVSGRACLNWSKYGLADRLYALSSLGVAILASLDIFIFLNLIPFMFTWALSCALFALASSLRLGAKSMETAFALERAHRELQKFNVQTLKMQRLSSIGMIVRGIVHDLKNYFHVSRQVSEMGLEAITESDLDEARECFVNILDSAKRAETYLQTMLEMSDGAQDVNNSTVSLHKQLSTLIKFCGLHVHIPRIEVIMNIPREAEVETDPRILQQVLLNLIFNATKALSDPGVDERSLTFSYGETPEGAVLSIADTGPGLPDEAIVVLESDVDALNLNARGVGLRLIRQGCNKLGIQLKHRPASPGAGTCFDLIFPVMAAS